MKNALLGLFLFASTALASNPAKILSATHQNSCAPWDGAAIEIDVEGIEARVSLYGESISENEGRIAQGFPFIYFDSIFSVKSASRGIHIV